jgi:hypothetical protein
MDCLRSIPAVVISVSLTEEKVVILAGVSFSSLYYLRLLG